MNSLQREARWRRRRRRRRRRGSGRCRVRRPGWSRFTITRPSVSETSEAPMNQPMALHADAADAAGVAHVGDAHDQRGEHQRRDDHLDQAQEDVGDQAEPLDPGLAVGAGVVQGEAAYAAGDQRDEDPGGQATALLHGAPRQCSKAHDAPSRWPRGPPPDCMPRRRGGLRAHALALRGLRPSGTIRAPHRPGALAPNPARISRMPSRPELANAIRALAMDAVQQANSGHPGMPMGMADIAEVLWNDFLRHDPAQPALAQPRPLRAVQRPRLDAAVRAAAPVRLRPADGRAQALPPAALEDRPDTRRPASIPRSRPPPARWARASPTRSAWRWPRSCSRSATTGPGSRSSTTTPTCSSATAA